MSRIPNGRMRRRSAREAFTEQSPYHRNGKRRSFTRSYDDTEIAYRSAPEYLRQLMNTSTNSARSLTRTHSATEMTPRSLGNPKYKAQEDYYDEVQALKKELKTSKDDNSNLRARIRRLEEDNARKAKEIDGFYDTNKDGDSRRGSISSTIPANSVVMNLKQRLFKLETQLKQKETTIEEMKNDPRWTKGTELEIQNRALFGEIEKQKIERLNFIKNDYMAAVDEEKKNAVRKLEAEKRELKIENENLKKKLHDRSEELSARQREESIERKLHKLKDRCRAYENEIEQLKDDLKGMHRDRDKYRDKFATIKEDFEEIKRQRDQYRQKLDRMPEHHDEKTSIRKPHDDIRSHSPSTMKSSSQNLRQKNWTTDDFFDQDADAKQHTKHGGTVSPRTSQQKLGSKIDNLGSGAIKNKEVAFKIVQAALRGYTNRSNLDKTTPRARNLSDDEDSISTRARKFENERKREDYFKPNIRDNNDKIRDSTSKFHRTPSPPISSPRTGSKPDGHKLGRFPIDDRESVRPFETSYHRTHSPVTDNHRASSPRDIHSRQSLLNDKNKYGSTNRFSRDLSPSNDLYSRKNPSNSKQSLRNLPHDDDDDVSAY